MNYRVHLLLALILWGAFLVFGHYSHAQSQDVKTLRLSDEVVAPVKISPIGTVLSFPVKPTKVILCRPGSFGIEYVENDLAISPLSASARSHLFVYLYGRRFSFDLSVGPSEGNSVILIRDAEVNPMPSPKPTATPPRPRKVKPRKS